MLELIKEQPLISLVLVIIVTNTLVKISKDNNRSRVKMSKKRG